MAKYIEYSFPVGETLEEIEGKKYVRDFHGNLIPENRFFRSRYPRFPDPDSVRKAGEDGLRDGSLGLSLEDAAKLYIVFFCDVRHRLVFVGHLPKNLSSWDMGVFLAKGALQSGGHAIAIFEYMPEKMPVKSLFEKSAANRLKKFGYIFPLFDLHFLDWIGWSGFEMRETWSLQEAVVYKGVNDDAWKSMPREVTQAKNPEGYRESGEYLVKKKPRVGKYVSPKDIHGFLSPEYVYEDREIFRAYFPDDKNRFRDPGYESHGGIKETFVSPFSLFRNFLRSGGSKVLCVHNHPSGDSSPSGPDLRLGVVTGICCKVLGAELVDFVTLGWYSATSLMPEIEERVGRWEVGNRGS